MNGGKRFAALLMAAALIFTLLPGCGDSGGEQSTDAPGGAEEGKVWVSEFTKLDGVTEYMGSPLVLDGKAYFSQNVYDSETGGYELSLWSVDLATGEAARLEGYVQSAAPEGYEESYININGLAKAAGGSFWVCEELNSVKFNLPEDFDEETGDKYQYSESVRQTLLRRVDAAGSELEKADLTAVEEAVLAQMQTGDMYGDTYTYLSSMVSDAEGRLCLLYNQSVLVLLSAEGKLLSCTALDGWWERLINLPDGGAALYGNGGAGFVLRPVDFETKGFGEDIALPDNAYNLRTGGGEYLAFYTDSSCIYGVNAGTGEGEQIVSLINCDVDSDDVNGIIYTGEGEFVCLVYSYDSGSAELARLRQVDASEVPPVTTLRLACNYLGYDLRKEILDFNRSNSGVRIEVTDYSQYNTEEDYTAGLTKLNTEIISGNVPDLFIADELPIEQYGAKGYLYDLYELIDADAELSREDFFPNILAAMETDGKLYSISPAFGVLSLVGSAEVLGEEMGWTLQELMEVVKAHPEAEYLLDPGTTSSSILQAMLVMNLGEYVDWTTGECSFDSQDFTDLLNFSAMFPETFDYSNYQGSTPALVLGGKQLLTTYSATDFEGFQMYEAMFGGKLAFKGFPSSDRTGNVAAPVGSRLSISSTCKDVDAAWGFVRRMLLEDYYSDEGRYVNGYPLNMAAYEKAEAAAIEKRYETDPETGEQVEVSVGGWSWDDFSVDIYAMTEEQAQQLRELIGSVERCYSYDQSIMDLVLEECADFFSGAKTAEQTASLIQDRVSTYVNEQR